MPLQSEYIMPLKFEHNGHQVVIRSVKKYGYPTGVCTISINGKRVRKAMACQAEAIAKHMLAGRAN